MTVGVLGTFVWDRILGLSGLDEPREGWGGIAYALSAMSASVEPGWRVLAIAKVGADLAVDARRLVDRMPGVDAAGLVVVPQQSNRVEIRYQSDGRRTERLEGGVPSWEWDELLPFIQECDSLYVNFISGFEMDLGTASRLKESYLGATYADLHSLFLGLTGSGLRKPRRLERWESWLSCFDTVQMNEEEFELLGPPGNTWTNVEGVLGADLELLLVTLGDRGAAYMAAGSPRPARGAVSLRGGSRSGDPTGCGDVWGATMFAQRLRGRDLRGAMSEANRLAGLSVECQGVEGLHSRLAGPSHMEEIA